MLNILLIIAHETEGSTSTQLSCTNKFCGRLRKFYLIQPTYLSTLNLNLFVQWLVMGTTGTLSHVYVWNNMLLYPITLFYIASLFFGKKKISLCGESLKMLHTSNVYLNFVVVGNLNIIHDIHIIYTCKIRNHRSSECAFNYWKWTLWRLFEGWFWLTI